MDLLTSFIIIVVAGLLHASFQLGTSMLTLLSSHTIGKKRSQARLFILTNSFVFGVIVMTTLLVSFAGFIAQLFSSTGVATDPLTWSIICGILIALGIAVWVVYYQKGEGTRLWLPRALAKMLADRAKHTTHAAEAFSLGLTSVIAELLFLFAPIFVVGLVLSTLEPLWQLAGVVSYVLVSSLSLLIVNGLVGGGHSISRIQKWREANKSFLQFAAGSGMIILAFYLYANQIAVAQAASLGGL